VSPQGQRKTNIPSTASKRKGISGLQYSFPSFKPPSLLAVQTVPTINPLNNLSRHDFYFQAEHGSLPYHASDILTTRTVKLVVEDFHLIRFAALMAAPGSIPSVNTYRLHSCCLRLTFMVTQ